MFSKFSALYNRTPLIEYEPWDPGAQWTVFFDRLYHRNFEKHSTPISLAFQPHSADDNHTTDNDSTSFLDDTKSLVTPQV